MRGRAPSVARSTTPRQHDDPSLVIVEGAESRGRVKLEVRVGPGDLGRVIGRRGRTAQSIRTVVRAAAHLDDSQVDVEFDS